MVSPASGNFARDVTRSLYNATMEILKTEFGIMTANTEIMVAMILAMLIFGAIILGMFLTREAGRYGFFCCCFSFVDQCFPGPPCQILLGFFSICIPCKNLRRYAMCGCATTAQVVTLMLEFSFTFWAVFFLGAKGFAKLEMSILQRILVLSILMPLWILVRVGLLCFCGQNCLCRRATQAAQPEEEKSSQLNAEVKKLSQSERLKLIKTLMADQ